MEGWVKKGIAALALIVVAACTGCERDHFPVSNEKKLDHEERIKDRYDVPTNHNDHEEPKWD